MSATEPSTSGENRGTGRVGERLRQAREALSLPLEAIAERSRVPLRHLADIEAGEHGALPAIPYSAGFVKVYAQLLGLDGAAMARDFRAEVARTTTTRNVPQPYEPVDPARVPGRLIAGLALIVALLLGVTYLYWRGSRADPDPRALAAAGPETPGQAGGQAAGESGAQPSATPASPRPAGAPAAGPVVLTAIEPVWLKVYERAGPTLFLGLLQPGQSFAVPAAAADPLILTGRPDMLRVTLGGAAVPPLGTPAQTIKDVSLAPAALRARMAAAPAAAPAPAPAPAP